jgi:hypothetical protein
MKKFITIMLAAAFMMTAPMVKAQTQGTIAPLSTTGAANPTLVGTDTALYTLKLSGKNAVVSFQLDDSVTSGSRVDTAVVQVSLNGIDWATLATQPAMNTFTNLDGKTYSRVWALNAGTATQLVWNYWYVRLLHWSPSGNGTIYPRCTYLTRY